MLHLLSKSINSNDIYLKLISAIEEQSHNDTGLVLYQDATYSGVQNCEQAKLLATLPTALQIYAVVEDANARGIAKKLINRITLIDYQQLVNLTIQHEKTISW